MPRPLILTLSVAKGKDPIKRTGACSGVMLRRGA